MYWILNGAIAPALLTLLKYFGSKQLLDELCSRSQLEINGHAFEI